jgi:hypothetical protein
LSRVTRPRRAKESLRPETIQLGRCKEFFRSRVRVRSGKDSFAPKESFPLLAFRTSERKPYTFEFPRNFRDSEYGPRKAKLWHRSCHVGPSEIFGLDQPMNVFESVDRHWSSLDQVPALDSADKSEFRSLKNRLRCRARETF